jgi:hypothetical protein
MRTLHGRTPSVLSSLGASLPPLATPAARPLGLPGARVGEPPFEPPAPPPSPDIPGCIHEGVNADAMVRGEGGGGGGCLRVACTSGPSTRRHHQVETLDRRERQTESV